MVKKVMLVASLAIAAVVVAPVASASAANEFVGTTTIVGTAHFTKKLPTGTTKEKIGYNFESGAGTECVGTVNGKAEGKVKCKAHVEGEGLLSCPASEGSEGKGYIEAPEGSGVKAEFKHFSFVAAGTNVHFTITKEGIPLAHGEASFAEDITGVEECNPLTGTGPENLTFKAVAAGKIGE